MSAWRLSPATLAAATTLAEPRLDPRGERVAWIAADGAGIRILVAPLDGGEHRVVVAPNPRLRGGALGWAGPEALAVAGADGGVWIADLTSGEARQLAEDDATGVAPSPDGSQVAFIRDLRTVCVVTTSGQCRVVDASHDFALDPAWSPDGTRLAWHAWDVPAMPWDESVIVVADAGGGSSPRVVAGGRDVAVAQPLFLADGRLGWLSDETGWMVPWVGGPDGTDARPLLETDLDHAPPAWGSGIRSWATSPDGRYLVADRNEEGFGRLVIHEIDTGEGGTVGRGVHSSITWEGPWVAALRSGARTPDEVVVCDLSGITDARRALGDAVDPRSARAVVASSVSIDRDALVEPELVRWTADDGVQVVGRLYVPPHQVAPHPLVVWTHGGPHDQTRVAWKHRIAFLVDRGWAVLCADHRGTTGHGRAWAQGLRGQWGVVDVSDTAAGVAALIERGVVVPHLVVAAGSSAGGFTTLLLLARHPGRFAGGIALYPVADLVDLQESTHRFEAHYNESLVGPWPEAKALYYERSPLSVAHQIRGPLLLLHGRDDEVVPVRQATDLVARIAAAGGDVDLKVFPGEGHGWHRPAVVAEELDRVGAFLDRVSREGG